MTKAAAKHEPELFAAPTDKQPKARQLTEGPKKGGRNPTSQIKERPPALGVISKKQEMVVHQAQPKSDIALMIEVIRDPGFDPAKAKALCDLRDHEEDRALQRQRLQAEIDFNEALARVKAEMPAIIGPDRKGDKHLYATLEKVSKTMDRSLSKEGFTISFGMAESSISEHYRITARLSRGLHSRDYFIDLPADTKGAKGGEVKTVVQGIGSTISYGRRYLKLMIVDLVVGKEDDDGQGGKRPDLITEEQADQIKAICAEKNIGLPLFQQAFRVQAVEDLPAIRYDDVIARLKAAPKAESKKETASDHE